ncbi:uncharacterized protein involved in exopolysaccharide biosynthesis [Paenibacillus sp. DS2015]
MSWRYDTRHLNSQQQSIIRKRDEEEASLKREKELHKKELQKKIEIIED